MAERRPRDGTEYRSMRRLYKQRIRDAKDRNIFWELTLEEFHKLTSANCVYCDRKPAQKSRSYIYNGIDCVDDSKGYTRENSVSCCKQCNFIKGTSCLKGVPRITFDEMRVMAQALRAFREANSPPSELSPQILPPKKQQKTRSK